MKVEIRGQQFEVTQEELNKYNTDVDSFFVYLENREAEKNKMQVTSKRSAKEFAESVKNKYGEVEGEQVIRRINKRIRSKENLDKIPEDIRNCENPLKFIMQAYAYFVGDYT